MLKCACINNPGNPLFFIITIFKLSSFSNRDNIYYLLRSITF